MEAVSFLLFILAGHFFGAYMFYFFHRYIFHGSLGKYPVLRKWSFFALYTYRHMAAHKNADTRSGRHHRDHHRGLPSANFSGAYPFIDKLFGTHSMVPVRVKRRK